MQASEGRSSCDLCPPGHFQNASGSLACFACQSGTYSSISGSAECNNCLTRLSSDNGATSCSLCDKDYFLLDEKTAATPEDCDASLCNDVEVECPKGSTLETLVLRPGYWRLSNRSRAISACSGGNATARCKGGSDAGSDGNGYCGELYTGPE